MGKGLRHRAALGGLAVSLLAPAAVILNAAPAWAANGVVSDGGDTGLATQLRQVVAGAAVNDTITFTVPTVTLTAGEILINKNLTIRGSGPAATTVTRNGIGQFPPFRIFHVSPSVTANIDLVTVSGGVSPTGGGIYVEGTLNLSRSTVTGDAASDPATALGGGIAVGPTGTAMVSNSQVVTNTATSDSIAIGAGIYVAGGTLTVVNSSISNNTATSTTQEGGGAGIGASFGPPAPNLVSVIDSVVSGNTAQTNAAGGRAEAGGIGSNQPVSVTNSVIQNNKVAGPAGATLNGGGVLIGNATLTIDRAEVSDNQAPTGGGGVAFGGGSLTVTNSTFTNNTASDGSAVLTGLAGPNTTSLSFTTVAANPSATGAALSNGAGAGTFTLNNSIVSNGATTNCAGPITQTGVNDTFGVNGTCVGTILTDPQLSAPAFNGGVNRTMALGPTSPAANAAVGCPASGVDQRGFPRTSPCDLGAFERGAVLVDATPPACSAAVPLATNPKQMDVSVTDTGRGLQTITNIAITNGTVVVPFFLPGTTQPVKLAAVKTVQASPTSWSFDAVDQALNSKHCS